MEVVKSIHSYSSTLRSDLNEGGVTQDYSYTSPSTADMIVLGRTDALNGNCKMDER